MKKPLWHSTSSMLHKRNIRLLVLLGSAVLILLYVFGVNIQLPKWLSLKEKESLRRFQEGAITGKAKFDFNRPDSLKRWQEKMFQGRVTYKIKTDQEESYLNACSKSSASGIIYRVVVDLKKDPMVSWKWRIVKFPDKINGTATDTGWVEKDDYAARFYMIFPRMNILQIKSLEYVWDKELPVGTILTNPYFSNIKIMVLQSGEKNLGQWVSEERNVYEDFKKAFGREPTKVGAIAIMTDSDNTQSIAEAEYDDIKVGYKNAKE